MEVTELIEKMKKLFSDYGVDLEKFVKEDAKIPSGVKGLLAVLDQEKTHPYSEKDLSTIKDICFYFM